MSIRRQLTLLLLLIGLAPTLLVSTLAYVNIRNSLTRKTADLLSSTTIKQEQKINGLLQKRQEDAIELANRFDLQSALGMYLASNGKNGVNDLAAVISDKKITTPEIQSVHLSDLNGQVIASTTSSVHKGTALPRQNYAIPEGQEIATTVQEASDGIDRLYLTTRVSVNKKESGRLSVVFRIDDIVAAVQDYTGLGSTGETIVAQKDANGDDITLFPLRFNTDAALRSKVNSLQLFETRGVTAVERTDYRGNRVLVSAQSVGFANWSIATKIDQREALAQTDQLRNMLVLIVVMSFIVLVVVALFFARFFSRPILHLANAAQLIGRGDFSIRTHLNRNDEIGMLAASIDAMGVSLDGFVSSIKEERNRLEAILNSITESVIATDKQGIILIANQAASELTQLDSHVIVGKHIKDVFNWHQKGVPFEVEYNKPGTTTYGDLEFAPSNGSLHYVKLIVSRVNDTQANTTAQTIVTIHDETKSRELEKMKVDFVSMAAHELRTPLAAVRGNLELINYKSGATLAEEPAKYLKRALKSTTELGGLINNLLDVTRIERGTLKLTMEKVDLVREMNQAIQDTRFNADDKHITLSFHGPVSPAFVMGDEIALREVMTNLITNAIKYSESHTTIELSLSELDGSYEVRVTDSGVGISEEAQQHLFTKFYRVHGGLSSGSTGTGLGLFIAKSIIQRHNGTISVDSKEGKGSTFIFTLPILSAEDETSLALTKNTVATRRRRGWITKNTDR